MQQRTKLAALLIAGASLGACNNTDGVGDMAMSLAGGYLGQYQITEIEGEAILADSKPELSLSEDGTVSGNTGCNNFSGKYEWVGTALSFGDMASTRKMCAPALMGQEQKLLGLLTSVKGAKLDGLDLVLTDGAKNPLVRAAKIQ
ncbi:META domain-containing protein [Simiduia curdlanivorans]|uniref:META domain-containing protein n=1 Tax=Simiduia curdlanivorans TaxID=1492769 RepID=A0ABV8V4N7_9GAMM|nr:META domain-containing protein [Simiduia curdlanivorans]MDN3640079.1 META domain-containing protein [Simiduia curdlanivorans]